MSNSHLDTARAKGLEALTALVALRRYPTADWKTDRGYLDQRRLGVVSPIIAEAYQALADALYEADPVVVTEVREALTLVSALHYVELSVNDLGNALNLKVAKMLEYAGLTLAAIGYDVMTARALHDKTTYAKNEGEKAAATTEARLRIALGAANHLGVTAAHVNAAEDSDGVRRNFLCTIADLFRSYGTPLPQPSDSDSGRPTHGQFWVSETGRNKPGFKG